jgi:plasmid stabilization system protein ParE
MFRSEIRRMASALAHDVGKYVARTARNVSDGAWTPELASMLLRDLYDLRGERALQAFLRLAPAATSPLAAFPEWTTAHDLLRELDAMEHELRAGHAPALQGAARRALLVESALRELALHARIGSPARKPRGKPP